jgi:hypothetical protein
MPPSGQPFELQHTCSERRFPRRVRHTRGDLTSRICAVCKAARRLVFCFVSECQMNDHRGQDHALPAAFRLDAAHGPGFGSDCFRQATANKVIGRCKIEYRRSARESASDDHRPSPLRPHLRAYPHRRDWLSPQPESAELRIVRSY